MTNHGFHIGDRYQGITGIALGGIVGGRLAEHIGREAEVVFHQPIRTGTEVELAEIDEGVSLEHEGEPAAEVRKTTVDVEVPEAVSWQAATTATNSYLGHHDHPYPMCFTCGPDRTVGEGLRIFPGPVFDGRTLAAPWIPHRELAAEDGTLPLDHVWAAVDCPGIWSVIEAAPPNSPESVVTGKLAVRVENPIEAGEPHVVTAWPLPRESGTWPTGAAVFDANGEVKVVARHTVVVTDWGVPLGLSRPDEQQ